MLNSMNMSPENKTVTESKRVMVVFNPRSWSIKWKAKINFLIRALIAIGLIVLFINLLQRRMLIKETTNKLSLLSDTKARYTEDYFINIERQIQSFASNRSFLEAFTQLNDAFQVIESENYFTPSVTDIDRLNAGLEGFYKAEIIPALENEDGSALNLKSILPADDNKQKILQFLYIANNNKPLGSKGNLNKADDGSSYTYMHSRYHSDLMKYAREANISDILFVDYKTGYVIYSVKKNLDFATNLFEGPYKNSGLGMAFKSAIAQGNYKSVYYTDATNYVPALYQPQMFISTPVYDGNQLLGALVFALNNEILNNLMAYDKESLSTNKSLKSILVGNDFLYRSDDPDFFDNKAQYIRRLKHYAANGETSVRAKLTGSTSMVQSVNPSAFIEASKGKQGIVSYINETGENVLCCYVPLRIHDLDWFLITQINKSEALYSLHKVLFYLFLGTLIIALILYYISGIINNSITRRLDALKGNINSLSKGYKTRELEDITSEDELGIIGNSLNILTARFNAASAYISELAKGNIDKEFKVNNDEDYFGHSLSNLRKSLIERREEEEKRKKEDEIRNWTSQGVALLNDIMREDSNSLQKLSMNIIRNIVQYLKANQGSLFLTEEDDRGSYLNVIAAYAFDRHKYLNKRIELGEGLAGTCVLEKKTILTNKIPENYVTITSGLGGAKPSCLLIVPLKKDEEVLGVIEIASFEEFRPNEIEFVEKVVESITVALVTVKLHQQTAEYLEKFQQQAEEMKAQDEELRQNIEEMQATHEQMERLKHEEGERNAQMIKDMEDYKKLLISVINEVPEKIFLKDDKGRFVIANKPVADNYNRTVDELLGKSDFDFYTKAEAMEYFQKEQEIMKSGKTQIYEEGDPTKYDGKIVRTIKKPFYIEHLGVMGLFGVQFDITDIKRKEYEAGKLAEEIQLKQNEIEAASIELKKEKALLDALLDSVPEHIYFKDKNSKFIRFSKSMLSLFGLEREEDLIGKSDFDFFAEEHAMPAFTGEQTIMKSGKPIIDLEEKEVMDDGRVSWVTTTKMPLYDINGKIIGTFGISKDITRIKMLQEESVQHNEELKAQEEELRQNLEEMMTTQEDLKRQLEENEKMKEKLADEKMLLDELLDKIPEHIYFKDKESRFLRFSKSMLKLFGVKRDEDLMGKSDFDFFAEEHARPAFEAEQKIIRTGRPIIDLEEKEVMEDGKVSWANTTKMPLHNSHGEIIGTFGISKDITRMKMLQMETQQHTEELKAQEEELRQNLEEMQTTQENLNRQLEENEKMKQALGREKALLDALLNNVPECIYFKDRESRFIRFSKSMLKLFGLKKEEELMGRSDFDFFAEEHAQPAFDDEQRIIRTGKAIIDKEEKEVHEDGRFGWVNTTKMPLRDSEGNIIGTFGISKTITHIKQLEIESEKKAQGIKDMENKVALLKKEIEELRKGKK